MKKEIVIIGGGPAGIEAAHTAVQLGAHVTLISNAPIGGRAGWHSLLPSKVWLTAADTLGLAQHAAALGITGTAEATIDVPRVLERIKMLKQNWNQVQEERLQTLGVEIVLGTAAFSGPQQVTVTNPEGNEIGRHDAQHIIIAGGSVPRFPASMKPDGQRIIAPRFASALDTLPASMIVVGGGATGSEFVYLFNRLGVEVTWVVGAQGVLPTFWPKAGRFMADTLAKRGVRLVTGQDATSMTASDEGLTVTLADGATYTAAMGFLAIGRQPDWGNLQLDQAGLEASALLTAVDGYGRVADSPIYFVGDAAGGALMANKAFAQAHIAARHAAGDTAVLPFNPQALLYAIYTEPQVAQVGRVHGDDLTAVEVAYSDNLKAQLLPESDGFVRLALETNTKRIMGGTAVGDHAGDVLAPVAVAIQAGLTVDAFAAVYAAHPTLSELSFVAARLV